jgi:hypothetical protein
MKQLFFHVFIEKGDGEGGRSEEVRWIYLNVDLRQLYLLVLIGCSGSFITGLVTASIALVLPRNSRLRELKIWEMS